jgi:hypothetical protein
MGLFDSIYMDDVVCPGCKKTLKRVEFQTKDFENSLLTYSIGDYISSPHRKLKHCIFNVYAHCVYKGCMHTPNSIFIKDGKLKKVDATNYQGLFYADLVVKNNKIITINNIRSKE